MQYAPGQKPKLFGAKVTEKESSGIGEYVSGLTAGVL